MRAPAMFGLLVASACAVLACDREERRFRESPPGVAATTPVSQSELQAGPTTPEMVVHNSYEENAWAVAEGKRLFSQFNCTGCHAHGGGAIGPPLMDAEWIYGSAPENIYATIVEGRPNGMPSFRGRLGSSQVWQLVAYVRSMSGLVPKDVAPGRNDGLMVKAPELAAPDSSPAQQPVPPGGERP
jgi:cytochrome c oxidase cbb3-type subunit 3